MLSISNFIKSNHIVSTVTQLALMYITFHWYMLAGNLNPDLKADLNEQPSMCHSIQIWIRLKKLYLHGKWQNHFSWIRNWIYITIFSEKFQNQCKKHTNNKVPLKHSPIIQGLILNMAVKSWVISLISIPFPIQARSVLESQVCSYCLNIGQDQLNVALTMSAQTKYW